jgi:hypothetical protein
MMALLLLYNSNNMKRIDSGNTEIQVRNIVASSNNAKHLLSFRSKTDANNAQNSGRSMRDSPLANHDPKHVCDRSQKGLAIALTPVAQITRVPYGEYRLLAPGSIRRRVRSVYPELPRRGQPDEAI